MDRFLRVRFSGGDSFEKEIREEERGTGCQTDKQESTFQDGEGGAGTATIQPPQTDEDDTIIYHFRADYHDRADDIYDPRVGSGYSTGGKRGLYEPDPADAGIRLRYSYFRDGIPEIGETEEKRGRISSEYSGFLLIVK